MGSYNVLPEDCLDLWALAASLQVRAGLNKSMYGLDSVVERC